MTINSSNRQQDFYNLSRLIKGTVNLAYDIELMSMNALIGNKDSGTHSGFSAVAFELSAFSINVLEQANNLSSQFSEIIYLVSLESNLNRRSRILIKTIASGTLAKQYILPASFEVQALLKLSSQNYRILINKVNRQIQRLEQLIFIGKGLSGVGKIEARYLGNIGATLFQIAEEVERIIRSISIVIQEIKAKLQVHST